MAFKPQNLVERAKKIGTDVASQTANRFAANLRNSTNISVDGISSAVEGTAAEITSAIVNPLEKVTSQFGGAPDQLKNGVAGALGGLLGGFPPWSNELEQFASYNYVIGLHCLTNNEINNPDKTYRIFEPPITILKSGGSGYKKVRTLYEIKGATEFYIDDLNVESIITPNPKTKQTNATVMDFKVTEPYSMGMFLQTLQMASLMAGHKNYLEAPFLLTIEFKGYDQDGSPSTSKTSRRLIPLNLTNVTFNVTEGGSEYTVEAVPWGEKVFSDQVQSVKTDISITGKTVQELLQGPGGLASALNDRLLRAQDAKQVSKADQYVFIFPTKDSSAEEALTGAKEGDAGATSKEGELKSFTEEQKLELYESLTGIENGKLPADFDSKIQELLGVVITRSQLGETIRDYAENPENINDIGKAEIVKSFFEGGKTPFSEAKFSEVEGKPGVFQRGKLTVSDKGRTFNFPKSTKIQDIIEELILLSDYGRQIATIEPDENNMVPWFKIEPQMYNITDSATNDQIGRSPRVYVYRIVPFKVSQSRFASPSAPSPNQANEKVQAAKAYNYIYTGKNKDILEFDIQIDSAFFVALNPMRAQASGSTKQQGKNTIAAPPKDPVKKLNTGNTETTSASGSKKVEEGDKPKSGVNSGATEHPETQVARDINEAIVNSPADLINVQMKIWGDPFYLADSGMGNYNAGSTPFINLNKGGSMDYQSSEVVVTLDFKTPIDYKGDGWMEFPGGGFAPVGAFSGLYQVVLVRHSFSKGVFTQDLDMIRRPLQEAETKVKAVKEGNAIMIDGGKENVVDNSKSAGQAFDPAADPGST